MKFWTKSAEAFLRKPEFCKKTRFYLIPMGLTTVTHVYHVDKAYSLGLILINVLETCTTVSKRSHNIICLWFVLFLHWACHRNSFVVTKDEFEVLRLPDLLFQWCSISLTVLLIISIGMESKKYFNLQHYIITKVLPHHQVALSNPECFLCCCFVVDFLNRFLFTNKACFSRYSDNVGV